MSRTYNKCDKVWDGHGCLTLGDPHVNNMSIECGIAQSCLTGHWAFNKCDKVWDDHRLSNRSPTWDKCDKAL